MAIRILILILLSPILTFSQNYKAQYFGSNSDSLIIINGDTDQIVFEGYQSTFPNNSFTLINYETDSVYANSSFLTESDAVDDWLFIPTPIDSGITDIIEFELKSIDANLLESVGLYIVIKNQFHLVDSINRIPNKWTTYNYIIDTILAQSTHSNLCEYQNESSPYFAIRHTSKQKQILLVDNIKVFNRSNNDVSIINSLLPKFDKQGTLVTDLQIKNYGSNTIDSIYIQFIIDNQIILEEEFKSLNLTSLRSRNISFSSPWDANTGKHYYSFIINLEEDSITFNDTLKDSINIVNNNISKTSLVESFTSSNCNPCQYFIPALDETINNTNYAHHISYPSKGDLFISNNQEFFKWRQRQSRRNHQLSIPFTAVNNQEFKHPYFITSNDYDQRANILNYSQISIQDINWDTSNQTLNTSMVFSIVDTTINTSDWVAYAALINESEFYDSINLNQGPFKYTSIVKQAFPDTNGFDLSNIKDGATWQINHNVDTSTLPYHEQYDWVVWIENKSTGEVIQSQKTNDFPSYIPSINSIQLQVYPNPANNTLSINSNQHTDRLRLSSINGQIINYIQLKRGNNQINTSQLKNGIYILSSETKNWSKVIMIQH